MSGNLVPGDHAFHDDKHLISELAALNEQLSRYVRRYIDADAGRRQPVSVVDEWALAESLNAFTVKLRERADRHAASVKGSSRA